MATIAPVRSSPIAGAWYEGNPKALARIVDQYLDQAELPELPGEVIAVIAPHAGQEFMALNGGPEFTFSSAISFFVNCETQEEVDGLWEKLSEGGEKQKCGWLKDKCGVSWQIVPTALGELLNDKNAEKSRNVMKAMLQMEKLDVEGLKRAYEQG